MRGRKSGSRGRRAPDGADSFVYVRRQLSLEPACLPAKHYASGGSSSQFSCHIPVAPSSGPKLRLHRGRSLKVVLRSGVKKPERAC
jgi:hypothetical protein